MSFDPVLPPYNASDPSARFLGASCLDFLLIELVPMAYRVTNELEAAALEAGDDNDNNNNDDEDDDDENDDKNKKTRNRAAAGAAAVSVSGGGSRTVSRRKMDEDEERDAVFYRLDTLGYRVGQGLVERFSRDRARFNDTLDVIKFLCKDLWMLVFRKQVDNLKTNHRVGGARAVLSHGRGPLDADLRGVLRVFTS